MDTLLCPKCGVAHDLSGFEPSYRHPDAYLAIPASEREFRTLSGSDDCRIRDDDDTHRQYFLRTLLPIPIRAEDETCSWGIWVEVSEEAFQRTRDLWDEPVAVQLAEPGFAATLANALIGYEATLGLPGVMRLTGPTTPPIFTLAADVTHPLAAEQRAGVFPERVLEWVVAHIH